MNAPSPTIARSLTMISRTAAALLLASAFAACGGSTGQYFHATVGQLSAPTGTDCPGQSNMLNDFSGIDGTGTWVIYPAPNNQFLLEGAKSSDLLVGTQTGSTYTFTGTVTQNQSVGTTDTVTVITKITITMNLSGPGFTGTYQEEVGCTSTDGMSCTGESNDGKDSDCTSSGNIAGTQITNVQAEVGEGASTASSP